jgi:acetyl-CoA decarbonylase/synthase complex subunit alpha
MLASVLSATLHGLEGRPVRVEVDEQSMHQNAVSFVVEGELWAQPVPEHLFVSAETREEAMTLVAKLCMRPNDTTRGRAIKLTHYIDLHRRLYGCLPDDIPRFTRVQADIPVTMKEEILGILDEKGWKESKIPDPTLIPRLVRGKKG